MQITTTAVHLVPLYLLVYSLGWIFCVFSLGVQLAKALLNLLTATTLHTSVC